MSREGFIDRWSRLKRDGEPASADEARADAVAVDAESRPDEKPDDRPDEEILAALGLPHPEALKPGDDVRGFMAAAVPDRLRRMALRKLWIANPVLANVDGLVEYGEDYTDAATVMEHLPTLFRVGKGMLRDEPAPEAAEPGGNAEGSDATADGGARPEIGDEARADEVAGRAGDDAPGGDAEADHALAGDAMAADEAATADEPEGGGAAERAAAPEEAVAPARRRMRFTFPTS